MKMSAAIELLSAAKEALLLLQNVQERSEWPGDNMPWPETDRLEQAIKRAEE